jgi:peptidoglycan/LPS O-acetylase OafA/YrhL
LNAGSPSKSGDRKGHSVQKFAFVDALRGIAILGVLLVHSGGRVELADGVSRQLVLEARFGVQLFYMVSAFTLYLSLDSRAESGFRAFFVRRFFRLAPMYWVAVALFCIYTRGLGAPTSWAGEYHFTWQDTVANLLMIHGLIPTAINSVVPGGWSVGVEWLFYALLPLIYIGVRNVGSALIVTGLAIALSQIAHYSVVHWLDTTGMAWGLVATKQQVSSFMLFYVLRQLPCFMFGVIAYYLMFPGNAQPARRWAMVVALLLWVFILGSFATNLGLFAVGKLAHEYVLSGIYLVVFFLMRQLGHASWIIRPLGYLGRVSYSIYLLHFLVLNILTEQVGLKFLTGGKDSLLVTFTACLLTTALLAHGTFHFIERPAIVLGRKLVARL